ncbi:hypothetical protein RIVERRIDER_95 [Xanthomonas phage RiverRider]|uniref:Uncharacterized protein n=1 Tax=Xanthomonas phage RiverRider TaxID=2108116 RepID=A0A2P1JV06_9CAUD|nr:hypothetical protein HWB58_gp40 [Xanthomonas phage RiverRider]AVO23176.1 hypothetical protein RIVERRIDER_95 [Xanthomonas phage RiverRider]
MKSLEQAAHDYAQAVRNVRQATADVEDLQEKKQHADEALADAKVRVDEALRDLKMAAIPQTK